MVLSARQWITPQFYHSTSLLFPNFNFAHCPFSAKGFFYRAGPAIRANRLVDSLRVFQPEYDAAFADWGTERLRAGGQIDHQIKRFAERDVSLKSAGIITPNIFSQRGK